MPLWLGVSAIAGLPSFVTAITVQEYHRPHQILAMLLGMMVFASGLSAIAGLRGVRGLLRHPYTRRTIRLGLIARGLVSVFPPLLVLIDIPMGWVSTTFIAGLLGGQTHTFAATFGITLVQGLLLSTVLAGFMIGLHTVRRAWLEPPTPFDAVPCTGCRYDLRGTATNRCPECGVRLTEETLLIIDRALEQLDSHLPEILSPPPGTPGCTGRGSSATTAAASL